MRRKTRLGAVPHPVTVESSEEVNPEKAKPGSGSATSASGPSAPPSGPANPASGPTTPASGPSTPGLTGRPKQPERRTVTIGPSVHIKGELIGKEDITVDGSVEGKIILKGHNLVIGPNARVKAAVFAKSVFIVGRVEGNITAEALVEVTESGMVRGDIRAPRVVLADGARFFGSVDMKPQPSGVQAPMEPSPDREVGDAAFEIEKKPDDEEMTNQISDQPDVEIHEERGQQGSAKKRSWQEILSPAKLAQQESSPWTPAPEQPSGEKSSGENKPDSAKKV